PRRDSRVLRLREHAVDESRAKLGIAQRCDNDDLVQIRSDDLLLRPAAGGTPGERVAPRRDGRDDRALAPELEPHDLAPDDDVAERLTRPHQPAAHRRLERLRLAHDGARAEVDLRHEPGRVAGAAHPHEAGSLIGSTIVNNAPASGTFSAVMRPLCSSMMRYVE